MRGSLLVAVVAVGAVITVRDRAMVCAATTQLRYDPVVACLLCFFSSVPRRRGLLACQAASVGWLWFVLVSDLLLALCIVSDSALAFDDWPLWVALLLLLVFVVRASAASVQSCPPLDASNALPWS